MTKYSRALAKEEISRGASSKNVNILGMLETASNPVKEYRPSPKKSFSSAWDGLSNPEELDERNLLHPIGVREKTINKVGTTVPAYPKGFALPPTSPMCSTILEKKRRGGQEHRLAYRRGPPLRFPRP